MKFCHYKFIENKHARQFLYENNREKPDLLILDIFMATGALQKVEEFVCREGMNNSVVCISARNFTGGKIGSCPILQKLAATLICLD